MHARQFKQNDLSPAEKVAFYFIVLKGKCFFTLVEKKLH